MVSASLITSFLECRLIVISVILNKKAPVNTKKKVNMYFFKTNHNAV